VVGGLQVLAAVLDPAHGPASAQRQQSDEEILRVHLAPHAEGATYVGLQEVHAVLGQPTCSATMRRLTWGAFVMPHMLSTPRPASHSARAPRVSSGTAECRCT